MTNISNITSNATAAYNRASQIANGSNTNFEDNLKQAQTQFVQNSQSIINSIKTVPSVGNQESWIGGILSNSYKSLKSTFKKAETLSIQSLTNEVDLVDVMTSLNEAEILLKTTQSIRDKMISAYLDIFKMPI